MKVSDVEAQHHQEHQRHPLLESKPQDQGQKTRMQQAITQTFKSTAHLAKLLPTGTVLIFQILSPVFANHGQCGDASRSIVGGLLVLCGLSCVLQSFTDSFKDDHEVVRYGFATFKGLWVIDGSATLPPKNAESYKIKFIDFIHAFMSLLVFVAVALFDQNVVSCFYPLPSDHTKEVLTVLPVAIGVICSMLFVSFPTTRHGIGFPIAPH